MIRTGKFRSTTLALAALVATASHGYASILDSEVIVSVVGSINDGETIQESGPIGIQVRDDGTFAFAAADVGQGDSPAPGGPSSPVWNLESLSVSGATNPEVTVMFTIVNTTASDADISVNAIVPISGVFGPIVSTFGSFDLTVLDLNADGATFSTTPPGGIAGTPSFIGSVDGVEELALFGPPSSISTPTGTATTSTFLSATGFAPEADTSIELDIQGTISPFDGVTVAATFRIEAVPEPTSALLMCLAGAGLVSRRRG